MKFQLTHYDVTIPKSEQPTCPIDKVSIKEKMIDGDRCDGCHVMAVTQEGRVSFHWMQENRSWDPWPDGAYVIKIPALYPAGEYQAEIDFLKAHGDWDEADVLQYEAGELQYDEGLTLGEIIVNLDLHREWRDWENEKAEKLAEEFLSDCNGQGDDPAPWGVNRATEKAIWPPFTFEWILYF